MAVILSITGLLKTVLILIGVFILLRFIGQLMIAKRNLAEHNNLKEQDRQYQKIRQHVSRNSGKTSVIPPKPTTAEDVDYEEL